ncbi:hypothetical protein TVAG_225530 [Trichomonas vaginalis G3]|uniref:Uncharacterized protein n=1 Tax=Trichomonas vaginalis (strain ATCC PRA-98 / G3) TaxID=412133 RepID=A2DNT2_TRIV3|nr:hypothetical protein TVAGG3_0288910 [Trichomonas vaginalis G3]EAY17927.1 hypothetical protein TVAG_225530 [Trichomonas vaginalis G3]KAI5527104.1 hypothetical protein TVAGG3_0288910 [Trichomonas vaginalis G3]|eukprot:XP_001578913.1 hypothetical protein [Trichomonas vaginalis G3]
MIFIKGILHSVPTEFLHKPIQTLLTLADPASPGYGIISTFVCSLCPNYISVEDLVPTLSSQYFASPMEFHNIFLRCNTQSESEILLGVKIFSRIMVLSFYWSRISAYYLSILLEKGRFYDKVQEWFSAFLLQLKASTIIQENERKYVTRRRRLKEIFTSSLFAEFVVVSDLFDISEYDEIIPTISEIEKKIGIEDLKYLPFHTKGLDLITSTKKKHRKKKKRSKSVPHNQPSTPTKDQESSEDLNPKPKKRIRRRKKKSND